MSGLFVYNRELKEERDAKADYAGAKILLYASSLYYSLYIVAKMLKKDPLPLRLRRGSRRRVK